MQPIFKKTLAGIAELERHTLKLRPELRRLLIMIDGKRSVDSLVPFFRPNELPLLVDELLQCGAIETIVPVAQIASDGDGDDQLTVAVTTLRGTLSKAQLSAAISAAKTRCKSKLGRAADRFISDLDKCTDSAALRVCISDIQLKLMADFGEDSATQFVTAVREAVRRSSS